MGIIVTGGTGAVGRAVVRDADGDVTFSYRSDADAADDLVAEAPERRTAVRMDVRDADSVASFAERAAAELGTVDGVVHTVGVVDPAPIEASTDEAFERVVDTNLTGAYRVARATIDHLRASAGSLVVVSSVGGTSGTVDVAYAASKAGLHGLVRALAREAGDDGVRVNAVAPGPVESPMNDAVVDYLESRAFHGHGDVDTHLPTYACEPAEVARAVRFLLETGYTQGQVVAVDGGMTI
jgi:3-oxoacyl-[acyl-carrier protein] reductase